MESSWKETLYFEHSVVYWCFVLIKFISNVDTK